ncbi:hypothetical protein EXIGLDRAFT_701431 [Exidia glandulosa HHB12029]|uniref:Transmembrane protein n=1 Tax=Exidia glandulosa HHB12029 TaxID=1314781 RepID=A0A165ZK70_EXIGL|nr:hypothetical protein EXIGLDRAFT_701431 [Exidia glandulosa HHB12029]
MFAKLNSLIALVLAATVLSVVGAVPALASSKSPHQFEDSSQMWKFQHIAAIEMDERLETVLTRVNDLGSQDVKPHDARRSTSKYSQTASPTPRMQYTTLITTLIVALYAGHSVLAAPAPEPDSKNGRCSFAASRPPGPRQDDKSPLDYHGDGSSRMENRPRAKHLQQSPSANLAIMMFKFFIALAFVSMVVAAPTLGEKGEDGSPCCGVGATKRDPVAVALPST